MLKQFVVESEFATSYKDTRRNSTLSQAGEVFGTAVLVVLLGAAHVRLAAQSNFGSIVGTVRDSSGAAVGGAEVSTRRVDNNSVRTAISDQAGTYQVLNLKPGRYEVTVAKRWNASQSIQDPQFGTIVNTVNTPTSILGSFLGGDASPRLIQVKGTLTF